jgi:hypothetical protein
VDKEASKITETVTEVEFRGHEYMVPPGIEGVANLVINIPRSSRGSRGGARVGENGNTTDCLFEVCCSLRLRINMPIGRCVVSLSFVGQRFDKVPPASLS